MFRGSPFVDAPVRRRIDALPLVPERLLGADAWGPWVARVGMCAYVGEGRGAVGWLLRGEYGGVGRAVVLRVSGARRGLRPCGVVLFGVAGSVVAEVGV
jgi:hypothetical protein